MHYVKIKKRSRNRGDGIGMTVDPIRKGVKLEWRQGGEVGMATIQGGDLSFMV